MRVSLHMATHTHTHTHTHAWTLDMIELVITEFCIHVDINILCYYGRLMYF